MHRATRTGAILCFSLLTQSAVRSADLTSHQETYDKSSGQICQTYKTRFNSLGQQYQKALETLKVQAQSQGDLSRVLAVRAEVERFLSDKNVLATNALPEISALQHSYRLQFNKTEMERVTEMGVLTAKYEQALDRLQKELVREGHLERATAVAAEREKAKQTLNAFSGQLASLKEMTGGDDVARSAPTQPRKPGLRNDLYMVIDLSRGSKADKFPVSYLTEVPKSGWTDIYKTDRLVLRKIEPGAFLMGSPESELGRQVDEAQHKVILSRPFFIGVFEVTQHQWERVSGDWPSHFKGTRSSMRPVEKVSYNMIRGAVDGAKWPTETLVDAESFIGKLRAKTDKAFDLPTEAQWEYACRAGTATALNTGKDIMSPDMCPNLSEAGRCRANATESESDGDVASGTARVGLYKPNAWGLYDMHGNVWEWCLDWLGPYPGEAKDPKGPASGYHRILRGGSWSDPARFCRTAFHDNRGTPVCVDNRIGFRLALPLD